MVMRHILDFIEHSPLRLQLAYQPRQQRHDHRNGGKQNHKLFDHNQEGLEIGDLRREITERRSISIL